LLFAIYKDAGFDYTNVSEAVPRFFEGIVEEKLSGEAKLFAAGIADRR